MAYICKRRVFAHRHTNILHIGHIRRLFVSLIPNSSTRTQTPIQFLLGLDRFNKNQHDSLSLCCSRDGPVGRH